MTTQFTALLAITISLLAQNAVAQELVVTMTNDPGANAIQVYDGESHALLHTLSTHGKGGVAGNSRGLRQFENRLLAAVNNGSGSVALFTRIGRDLVYQRSVTASSAPVSAAFGNGHLYVAGATTVDSFAMFGDLVLERDGTATLALAEGTVPPAGSTAQVGALPGQVLVTLKSDPSPGTVDVISLDSHGAISGKAKAVAAPTRSLTPFGFETLDGETAFITLAHSGQVGLFRDGEWVDVINSGDQAGPCWTTTVGEYILIVNAGSQTVSREISTGQNIFIDAAVAASVTTGGTPTDTDENDGKMAVLDHTSSAAHLSFFDVDALGNLTADGLPIDLQAPAANGVAVLHASGIL